MKYQPYTGIDYLGSSSNSESLCRTIRAYWRKRGLDVEVWVERDLLCIVAGKKRWIYTVRSSLYGGSREKTVA